MDIKTHGNKHTLRNLIIFTFLVITLGWFGCRLDSLTGSAPSQGIGITIWIIAPLGASFLLRAFAGDGWKDMGIRPATLIPLFLAGTIAASLVYGEIRILTKSVWPAVLMQTAGGAFVTALIIQDFIKIESGMELLFSPVIEGVLTIILFTLIGVGIYLVRRKRMTVT